MRKTGKKLAAIFLAVAMVLTFVPVFGAQTAYAAADTITRVDLTITPNDLDDPFRAGDAVVQPAFTVTNVESTLGTVSSADLEFIQDQWIGWCRSIGGGEWFKYQEDGIQDLFFTAGESRMMVDLWADCDAVFTSDTEVYLNGQKMSFYKTYDGDTDWVGYLSREAVPVVSEIEINFDPSGLPFNTVYTEEEMSAASYDLPLSVDGVGCYSDDKHFSGLYSWDGSTWTPAHSANYLDAVTEYAIFINVINNKEGYEFPVSLTSSEPYSAILSGDLEDVSVIVNGVVRDDVELHFSPDYSTYGDCLYAYIPLGKPSMTYVAPEITLTGSTNEMEPGHTRSFEAKITGTISDKTILWSVTGNSSSDTAITDGTLVIGRDETASAVTITAASAVDATLTKSLVIPITYDIKPVDRVEITPAETTVARGRSKRFTADVIGEQENKAVTWSVSGAASVSTTISDSGTLTVGEDETVSSLRVYAVSVADPTKSADAIVFVRDPEFVSSININHDLTSLPFDIYHTEKEVNAASYDVSLSVDGVGCYSDDKHFSGLYSWDGDYWAPVNSENYLDAEKEYAIYINVLDNADGYDFPASLTTSEPYSAILSGDLEDVSVTVNGVARDDVELHFSPDYSTYGDCLYVYIPIGRPAVALKDVTFPALADKTYTGKALTQTFTPKYNGKDLVKGVDYKVTYSNNVKAGTAKVVVEGMGRYTGTKTLTFKINPVKLSSATLKYSGLTYNGKARTQTGTTVVKAKVNGTTKTLKSGTDYTITYKNNKNVGKATMTIKGKGNYTGTLTKTFKINPKGTTLTTPAAASKAVTVKWNKQSQKMSTSRITGYQIQLATDSKFTKNKKTVTVPGYAKTSKKVTGLKGGKKYYVKIRTYKTVSGVKYYSPWSKAKTVTTKK